jgi:hypothetical protein
MDHPSDLLKKFFEKQRRKYKEQFLKDICSSGQPMPASRGPEEFPSQIPATPRQQASAEPADPRSKDQDHVNE